MTLTREVFDNTLSMLNIVATTTQADNAYLIAYREFFSLVSPVIFISAIRVEELLLSGITITEGMVDDIDSMGLGIGSFRVKNVYELIDGIAITVKPEDSSTFKIDFNYAAVFAQVSEFFLKKVEKDNMRMLKSAGIDDGDMIDEGDLIQLREHIKQSFGVSPISLVM